MTRLSENAAKFDAATQSTTEIKDKFVLKAQPDGVSGNNRPVMIRAQDYNTLLAIKDQTGYPLWRICAMMIRFCSDRLEIRSGEDEI